MTRNTAGFNMRQHVAVLAIALALASAARAESWEVVYAAGSGLLPTQSSPAWSLYSYGAPISVENGFLHIGISASGGADYTRDEATIPAGVPVTVEARLQVLPCSFGDATLQIGTYGTTSAVIIRPDHMGSYYDDFTTLRTVRFAYDGSGWDYVWVDGQLAISSKAPPWKQSGGTPAGVFFGSGSCDSYWQYVAYSKEFLPIPEPCSLAALLAGLVGFGAMIRRRR
jgi:hypothetical protein